MNDMTVGAKMPGMVNAAAVDGTDAAKAAEAVKELAGILAGANVNVTSGVAAPARGSTAQSMLVALDEAEVSSDREVDIEALVAKLTVDMDESSAKTFLAQLKEMNKRLDAEHTETMKKIDEATAKAEKAAKASKWQKALGWLGAIVAVVVAVAVTVVTGGAAAAFAIAGASLALGSMIMDETGATEKLVNALAESMKKTFNLSDAEAKAWAGAVWGGIMLVTSVALSITGAGVANAVAKGAQAAGTAAKVAGDVAQTTSKIAAIGAKIKDVCKAVLHAQLAINLGTGLANTTAGVVNASYGYDASKAQTKVTDLQAFLNELQTLIEQQGEDLEKIMEKLSDSFDALLGVMESSTDTQNKILMELNQMA